jgi:2-dehydropantoate 2-reductase
VKICVVGAGAIGGLMGARLALAGEEVTLISRGVHLDAIRQKGLKLIEKNGSEHVAGNVKATSKLSEPGTQDIVVLTLKAHQIEPIAREIPGLFHGKTMVVTTQNGIPWWYFQKHGGEFEGRRVEAVDPYGNLLSSIEVERILGCVVYPAAEIVFPGVIRLIEGNRFPVGELDGCESERAKAVSATLVRAGFKSPVVKDIRSEIWLKLWGNLSFNPMSALTHSTLVDICQFPLTRQLAADMMTEAQTIANKLGVQFRVSLEKRIVGAEKVGKHKTSMLQDIEIGHPIEIDALVGAVIELGRLTQTPTPHIDSVYACVKLLAKTLGEEKGKLKVEKVG